MIHEYEPGNPFRSDLYPEPKFDDLYASGYCTFSVIVAAAESWLTRPSISPGRPPLLLPSDDFIR